MLLYIKLFFFIYFLSLTWCILKCSDLKLWPILEKRFGFLLKKIWEMKDQNRHKGKNKVLFHKWHTKLSFDPYGLSLFIFHSCFFKLLILILNFIFYILVLKGLERRESSQKKKLKGEKAVKWLNSDYQ